MGHIINGLAFVLGLIFNLVQLLVIASIIISWVNADPYNPIVRAIRGITEPLYRPLRRLTSRIPGPLDFAPLLLILMIVFLQKSLIPYLVELSRSLHEHREVLDQLRR